MDTNTKIVITESSVKSNNETEKRLSFPDLPAELRNRVYHDWLTIVIKDGERKVLSADEFMFRFNMVQSIFCNNRQLTAEATSFFASTNIIHLQGSSFGCTRTREHRRPTHKTFVKYTVKSRKFMACSSQDSEYSFELELPPTDVRPLLGRIKLTVHAPYWKDFEGALGRETTKYEKMWEAEDVDLLYPIREMKTLGFTRLELLDVSIVYQPYFHGSAEREEEFKAWTRQQIKSMSDAKEVHVQF